MTAMTSSLPRRGRLPWIPRRVVVMLYGRLELGNTTFYRIRIAWLMEYFGYFISIVRLVIEAAALSYFSFYI